MGLYDRFVETAILVGVWLELGLMWALVQERTRSRLKAMATRLIKKALLQGDSNARR